MPTTSADSSDFEQLAKALEAEEFAQVAGGADCRRSTGYGPRPGACAILIGDITCDSDGKIDQFIDRRNVKRTLALHAALNGAQNPVGLFLVGAYQEILGDLKICSTTPMRST